MATDRSLKVFHRIAPGDQLRERSWPATVEEAQIADGVCKRTAAGVHDPDDRLVAEDEVGHDGLGIERLQFFCARNAGEDE